jgi:hypothetical protein
MHFDIMDNFEIKRITDRNNTFMYVVLLFGVCAMHIKQTHTPHQHLIKFCPERKKSYILYLSLVSIKMR